MVNVKSPEVFIDRYDNPMDQDYTRVGVKRYNYISPEEKKAVDGIGEFSLWSMISSLLISIGASLILHFFRLNN